MGQDKLVARAKNNAYLLLRLRPRSEEELKARLKDKGYDDEIVSLVVDDLKKRGLVDDRKFAKFWVNSRMHLKPVGDFILKTELKAKGVSGDIIEATLASKRAECDEYEVAKNIAVERYRRLKGIDRRTATKRAYDFLLRRGFKYDVIRRVIEEIIELPHDEQ